MKGLTGIFLFCSLTLFAQQSEDLVPHQAVTVFSLNNINILQQISLDDLVKYEFMEELQAELFDGSTSGKTIKESGIDFNQKLNVFNGKGEQFTVNGFTFGISDKDLLFETFDDFQPIETSYSNVELYVSYFNRIAIKGNSGILFRVAPTTRLIDQITDSIWYARGNDYPWYNDEFNELFEQMESVEEDLGSDMETEENTINPVEELPVAGAAPDEKTYFELRDSVDFDLQEKFITLFMNDLFRDGKNLIKIAPEFKSQLTHDTEATLYSDNSRRIVSDDEFWYFKSLYPTFFHDIKELYEENTILGDLKLENGKVSFHIDMNYSDDLGSIYQELTRSKFDPNIAKYISKDASAFFTYNVNMLQAYKKTFEVLSPILEKSNDKNVAADLLLMELLDFIVDEEDVFGMYKGSMFGTYQDIQKVKTKKIIWDYDEETFEYIEQEVEAEEDMPIFTLGFSTGKSDLIERLLKRMTKLNEDLHREANYWVVDNAVLGSAPLYLINKNGLFIVSNDTKFAKENSNGFESAKIDKAALKKAKKNGALYAKIDLDEAITRLPGELFSERENNVLNVLRGKDGLVEVTTSATNAKRTSFDLVYTYNAQNTDAGSYILDLINSIYVISK